MCNSAFGQEEGSERCRTVPVMETPVDMAELELALLRRGVDERLAERERCRRCRRTPLIGERVYLYDNGSILCELCREGRADAPLGSRITHGPAFGHTIRILDLRDRSP
jgi:hypothetical protein